MSFRGLVVRAARAGRRFPRRPFQGRYFPLQIGTALPRVVVDVRASCGRLGVPPEGLAARRRGRLRRRLLEGRHAVAHGVDALGDGVGDLARGLGGVRGLGGPRGALVDAPAEGRQVRLQRVPRVAQCAFELAAAVARRALVVVQSLFQ